MFPRDRVMVSLKKYAIAFTEDGEHRGAAQQARRVLRAPHHHPPADPAGRLRQRDLFLAGDQSAKTTGHVIPVDGGLPEAFLR